MPEIVGEMEIAARLHVEEDTVRDWAEANLLPVPEGHVAGFPAWRWDTVREWARRTGRLGLATAGNKGSNNYESVVVLGPVFLAAALAATTPDRVPRSTLLKSNAVAAARGEAKSSRGGVRSRQGSWASGLRADSSERYSAGLLNRRKTVMS
jgi:hypothetical protein